MNQEAICNPNRLRIARLRRLLTIKGLAEKVGMSTRLLSHYENNNDEIRPETLRKIANALDYPIGFFVGEDIEELDENWVSFRSLSRMKAYQKNAALSAGSIAILLNGYIEKHFKLRDSDLPNYEGIEPEAAATALREKWGMGTQSVSNMIHWLELKGIRVFSLAERNKEVNAYSFWKGETPYIFLNTFKSAESSRFDCAHELAHLVLHLKHGPRGREAEIEADKFASAFLMPKGSVLAHAPKFANIPDLIKLKKMWNVSLAALVRRLKDLEIITEWQYRSLNIDMSSSGMHKNEPDEIERETSQILAKVFHTLRERGITKREVAKELCLPEKEIDDLVFGLAFIGLTIEGSGYRSHNSAVKPFLRLVE